MKRFAWALVALFLTASAAQAIVKSPPAGSGGGGGGSVSAVISPNSTIAVTNSTGPTVNVDVTALAANSFYANATSSTAEAGAINPLAAANLMAAVLSVNVVATSNVTLSGVQTIDGITGTPGQTTALLTAQSDPSTNGIYVEQSGAWALAVNFPSGYVIAAGCNLTVEIQQGTLYAGSSWWLNTNGSITIGTDAQYWQQAGGTILTTSEVTSIPGNSLIVGPGSGGGVLNLNGASNSAGAAGTITIVGGTANGTTHGSTISITASAGGNSTTGGPGGTITITSGAAGGTSGNGGNIAVNGGAGTGSGKTGASITLTPGAATSSATPGVVNLKGAIQFGGTQGALSGCSATGAVGGVLAGQYTSGTSGTCTVTIVLPAFPSQNGYACDAHDETTSADYVQQVTATTTQLTISGTTVSGDTVKWHCAGF